MGRFKNLRFYRQGGRRNLAVYCKSPQRFIIRFSDLMSKLTKELTVTNGRTDGPIIFIKSFALICTPKSHPFCRGSERVILKDKV